MRGRLLLIVLWAWCAAGGLRAEQAGPAPAKALSKELDAYLKRPEREIDLGLGALWISKEERPKLDVDAAARELDDLARKLAPELAKAGTASGKLDALRKLLFDQQGYGLPKKDDAAAFLLSDVLANKRGNCLGLSVLCLALAERTGLPLHGVPVPSRDSGPGHLLVRYDDGTTRCNFDPTERGAARDDEHYRALFKLTPDDLKAGYILGNARKRDVLNLLLVNLGGARVESRRAAEALPLLEGALALNPSYAPAHNNLGAARLNLGDLAGAETAFAQAVKLDGNYASAHVGLAGVAVKRGQFEKAEEEAMTVEALEPANVEAKVVMANVYLARKNYRAARSSLKEALRLRPRDARLTCNLGAACMAEGEFGEATQAYKDALEAEPENLDAQYGLAEVQRLTGQTAQARAAFEAILKKAPGHVPTRVALATMAAQAKDTRTALTHFQAALKEDPANADALTGLTEMYLAQGRPEEADRVLADARKLQPENTALAVLSADAKMRRGEFKHALALLDEALPKVAEANRVPLQQRIAVCCGKMGDHRRALQVAREILKAEASDLTALHLAAAASEALRQNADAVGYFKRILELDPTDKNAKAALARLSR
ncbi:MAG: tetratricopeptide repeat protein [Planctomycetota bacterium]|nr:tetratricopeptide repeat protein [Planctomycetota bacterium]